VRGHLGRPREALSFGHFFGLAKKWPRAAGIEKKGLIKKMKHSAKYFDVLI
jgi:hypothetical protein